MYHYSDRVITDTVVANIKRLIDEQDEGIPTRAARRCNMNQRTLDRFYKGERQPTLELVEQVARGYGYKHGNYSFLILTPQILQSSLLKRWKSVSCTPGLKVRLTQYKQ